MTIRRFGAAAATAGLVATTLVALTPVGAQAADRPSPGATRPGAATASPKGPRPFSGDLSAADTPDGNFYAWEHADFQGRRCSWAGSDGWWGDNCVLPVWGGFDNIASSVFNNGYPGAYSTVMLYKNANTTPNPNMCINAGDYYANLALGYEVFSDLCRPRHKSDYAEPPVMPRPVRMPIAERPSGIGSAA